MVFIILLKKTQSIQIQQMNIPVSIVHNYEDHLNSSTPQHNVNTINSYYIILGFSFNFYM